MMQFLIYGMKKLDTWGIGAMLFAGLLSFLKMLKPLITSIRESLKRSAGAFNKNNVLLRTEQDIPFIYLLLLSSFFSAVMFIFFQANLPLEQLGLNYQLSPTLVFLFVLYVFIIGFIFAVITGFFSGLVGVTASPGSSIIIAGMLLLGWLLLSLLKYYTGAHLTNEQIKSAEAITIIIGAVVTGIAAIANDNIQDLKVGYILGATPWKQQLMLLLGVIVASLIIPPIMQLLFDVYGIAGVMPHSNMDPSQSLPAPPAALMAAITQAIFHHGLPWLLLSVGALMMMVFLPISYWLKKRFNLELSILGMAIGIYLPMTSSVPLFIGGLLSLFIKRRLNLKSVKAQNIGAHKGLLLACGLVAGAALMDVLLAIPFSLAHSSNVMQLDSLIWDGSTIGFALLSTAGLAWLFKHLICDKS